ncbi:MAG: DUF2064 domain-containing protein [Spirochaetes bacterium]|nr:DUF2064 domain-containing protein [Spirochaetota bacterium]
MLIKECLLYFVKYPEPGKVKTRLASAVGYERAAEFYSALALDIYNRFKKESFPVIVFFSPENALAPVKKWLPGAAFYKSQKGESIGERMTDAFETAFSIGYERVILTGSEK